MAEQPFLPFDDEAAPAEPPPPPEDRGTARLIEELARVCREHPLDEKVLIATSLAIGHTLVERLAREGHAWINLRVETPRTLAHRAVGADLAREGRRLLSRAQALALVEQACAESLSARSYFGGLRDRPGLHRALQRTLEELRAAGIEPGAIPASAFADARKPREIRAILERYAAALEKGKSVDALEVLRRAAKKPAPAGAAITLLPADAELSDLERRFLETLGAGRPLTELAVDAPADWRRAAAGARLFRAIGEENEIREAFRRILEAGTPFDDVEILHTDASVYPALVWELSREYGIPCTFGGGIAVTYSRPGQAVLAFLEWIGQGFAADRLRESLASGALTLQTLEPDAGDRLPRASSVARELRRARIGWGRARHLTALDRHVRTLEEPERPSRRDDDETSDPESAARRARTRALRLDAARLARRFTGRVLELAPDPSDARDVLRRLARGARAFVGEFARVAGELDATAKSALDAVFEEIAELPPGATPLSEAVDRLRNAVLELHVAADRPRPGRVHVAFYAAGAHSGRRHTFLAGLDEARHPGRDLEDPVLLDEERRGINASLPRPLLAMERERPREAARALQTCVARLRGTLTASYSKFDLRNLSQAGEPAPSPFFLDLYRESSGQPDADYRAMLADLERAEGFVPAPGRALDDTEWWLAKLAALPAGAGASGVRAAYPWLRDGLEAEDARASGEFTAWDGRLRGPTPELDPRVTGHAVSASRIQALAHCPFAYFVRNVLHVEAPDDLERDPTRWLEPKDEGTLLHEVFRIYFERLTERGEKPDAARDVQALEAIAEEQIAAWRERVPPSSDVAFQAQREGIRLACRTFLHDEAVHCAAVTPRWFEVPFGLPRVASPASIASPDPVEIALGGGKRIFLRGSIDRVDEGADGTFHVWDYKTGSPLSVREGMGLRGGRQAQPALYAMAFEALLARSGRDARVSQSGYFFPGRKGEGQRVTVRVDAGETRGALSKLLDLVAAGMFPHASSEDDCRFCDFGAICGGAEAAGSRAREKLAETSDPVLAGFRDLHDDNAR